MVWPHNGVLCVLGTSRKDNLYAKMKWFPRYIKWKKQRWETVFIVYYLLCKKEETNIYIFAYIFKKKV